MQTVDKWRCSRVAISVSGAAPNKASSSGVQGRRLHRLLHAFPRRKNQILRHRPGIMLVQVRVKPTIVAVTAGEHYLSVRGPSDPGLVSSALAITTLGRRTAQGRRWANQQRFGFQVLGEVCHPRSASRESRMSILRVLIIIIRVIQAGQSELTDIAEALNLLCPQFCT